MEMTARMGCFGPMGRPGGRTGFAYSSSADKRFPFPSSSAACGSGSTHPPARPAHRAETSHPSSRGGRGEWRGGEVAAGGQVVGVSEGSAACGSGETHPRTQAAHPSSRGERGERCGGEALLQVKDLHVGYGDVEIVHGASFTASRGEFVCIIGANGCGKTTTLKCMLGLLPHTSGSVTVAGRDTLRMAEKERARHFAYIPQAHTPPFPFSVADVVILGRTPYVNSLARVTREDKRIAYEAMALLGIEGLAGRIYTELSGGQQQLVLIARALAQQTDVLVMDEPTASLDFGNQQMVLSQMKKLTRSGTSVIMVTHDPDHALFCADKVVVMHEGRVIAEGAPDDVMTDECLHTIYGTAARIVPVELEPGLQVKVCVPLMVQKGQTLLHSDTFAHNEEESDRPGQGQVPAG